MGKNGFIEGVDFIKLVDYYFDFLDTDWHACKVEEEIVGQFYYSITFQIPNAYNISINLENAESYLDVVIFTLDHHGKESTWENSETYHLSQFNDYLKNKITQKDHMTNKAFFQTYSKTTDIEKLLLGAAQKLRLFLIYYLYGSNNVKQVSRK